VVKGAWVVVVLLLLLLLVVVGGVGIMKAVVAAVAVWVQRGQVWVRQQEGVEGLAQVGV
jgi:hypothetical protein